MVDIFSPPRHESEWITVKRKPRRPHIVNTPTEYSQAARMGKSVIPPGEDPDNWISLYDSKKKKKIYSKVPQFMKKADYEFDMRNKITSLSPIKGYGR